MLLPEQVVVAPLGVVGMAVATMAMERAAMMDWNCIFTEGARLEWVDERLRWLLMSWFIVDELV